MDLTITKKIAKSGDNLILIISKSLHSFLEGGDLVKVNISKLEQEMRK